MISADVGRRCLLAALLLSPAAGLAAEPAGVRASGAVIVAQATPAAMVEYHFLLAQYLAARGRYEAEAEAYWNAVAEKRRLRVTKRRSGQDILLQDYVLAQPPVYAGPPRPVDPSAPAEEPPSGKYVPVVADFLQAAAREFKFAPRLPQSEIEYKRAYARIAAAAGLTAEQAVRVYAFESGGNGKYDVQAGLEYPRPDARAISTALGYNQLLSTNSVELLAEKGDHFLRTLQAKATAASGEARAALQHKVAVLRSMVAVSRSVPDSWSAHGRLAGAPKGLAIHALNLDLDVGPLLQVQKLLELHPVRTQAGICRHVDRGRARDDEPDRRRQRHRHDRDAGGMARTRPHREFLPAGGLSPQSRRHSPQRRGQARRRDRRQDGPRGQIARRQGHGGDVSKIGPPTGTRRLIAKPWTCRVDPRVGLI